MVRVPVHAQGGVLLGAIGAGDGPIAERFQGFSEEQSTLQQSAPRSLITRDPLVNPNAQNKDVGATKHERGIAGDSEWIGAIRRGWILGATILPSNSST